MRKGGHIFATRLILCLKGTLSKDASWPQNVENMLKKKIHLQASYGCLSIFIQTQVLMFASNLSSSGGSHFGMLSTNEEQNSVGLLVLTFDITDNVPWKFDYLWEKKNKQQPTNMP